MLNTKNIIRLFENKNDDLLVGYKVMMYDPVSRFVISGRDNRQKFKFNIGEQIKMKHPGCYLGMNKQYVLDYYSELASHEVLLTLEFKRSDIVSGNINDREPELSVKLATIIDFEILDNDD